MKKQLLWIAMGILCPVSVFAGGILTNANQSASYIRMLARDASTSVDAAYYNPAGLIKLNDGLHFSFNNQTVFQTRTIENNYPLLNEAKYTGNVTVPFFPSAYAVYKHNNWAFSGSFTLTSGGGKASYNKGLPSFETDIASIPALLSSQGISTANYNVDIAFNGTSVFYGYQFGASYEINKKLGVYAGLRLVNAVNTYKGSINNIMINPVHPLNPAGSGNFVLASQFFSTLSAAAGAAVTQMQPIIDAGAGGYTLDQLQAANQLSATQAAQLKGGLGTAYNSNMTAAQVQAAYQTNQATTAAYAQKTTNKTVDARQTGVGYTPILGVNIQPVEGMNIGIRYEFITKMKLENKTKKDDVGMFPDGEKTNSDVPAILSVGIDYKFLPDFKASVGLHHYFDKNANWDGREKFVNNNLYELAAGLEYNITPKILISAGYLYSQTGVGQGYQSDISFSLSSHTVGFGGMVKVTDKLDMNLGMLYTSYIEGERSYQYSNQNVKETYNRNNLVYSIGFDYHL